MYALQKVRVFTAGGFVVVMICRVYSIHFGILFIERVEIGMPGSAGSTGSSGTGYTCTKVREGEERGKRVPGQGSHT